MESNQILSASNYDLFSTIVGNRSLNISKIEKISKDVNNGFNMLQFYPIIVYKDSQSNKLCVIDGQHRFEVSKRNDLPVYYVICENISLKQIATLNSRGEKWKPSDFLNCYIRLGIKDYEDVKDIMSKYQVNIKLAVDLLYDYKHHGGAPTSELFQDGNFKTNFYSETVDLLELVKSVFGRYRFCFDRYLVGAVIKLLSVGKCDFERLKNKISQAPMMMDKQGDVKSYLNNIERIYNFKTSSREVIF